MQNLMNINEQTAGSIKVTGANIVRPPVSVVTSRPNPTSVTTTEKKVDRYANYGGEIIGSIVTGVVIMAVLLACLKFYNSSKKKEQVDQAKMESMRANSSKVAETPKKSEDQKEVREDDQTFARELYQTADAFNINEIDDPIELFDVE